MNKDYNPFISVGYTDPEHFRDRNDENKLLNQYMKNGINVTLFAIRRLGKTGLIHHVFYPYRDNKKVICIYLAILATNNLTEFTNQIATAVYNQFPQHKRVEKKIMSLIKSFRPIINFDEFTGKPTISLTLDTPSLVKRGLDVLLNKELISYNSGVEKPNYEVYDKYLMRWMQNRKARM